MGTTTRPYFSLSVGDLESVFDKAQGDPDILELLQNELTHRKTERAAQLAKRIREILQPQRANSTTTRPVQRLLEKQPTPSNERPTKRERQSGTPASQDAARPTAVPPAASARPAKKVPPTNRHVDDPASIIETWTAMEALLRRPIASLQIWLTVMLAVSHSSTIAVLGAPMKAQQGARSWAASTPNILNVMVSRAKRAIYVVGSRTSWSTSGHGRTMAKFMDSRAK